MLTEKQKELVTENHNLIYWYIHSKNLVLEDWYDIFSIVLCEVAICFDETKGKFSTLFKLMCDQKYFREIRKKRAKKRDGIVIPYQEGFCGVDGLSPELLLITGDLLKNEVLNLKFQGYTQREIGERVNKSQAWVSRTLSALRDDYYKEG